MITFNSKITKKLLEYYFTNPSAEHYVNELSRLLEIDPGNLDRKLKELKREGILISKSLGRQKYYSLNKKYPVLEEIKKIFEQKYGLKNSLLKNLKIVKGIKEAYI